MRLVKRLRTNNKGTRGLKADVGGIKKDATSTNDVSFERDYKTEIIYDESTKTFHMYLLGAITAPEDYTNVLTTFNTARDDETIRCYFSGPGGRKDTTDIIRHAVYNTNATTIAIIGDCASADTIIPLAFDDLEVMPNVEYMIHSISSGYYSKYHEVVASMDFWKKEMPNSLRSYYKDFLTEEEIEYVIAGNDIYLNSQQVEERWQRVQEVRNAEFDEFIQENNKHTISSHLSELERLGVKVTIDEPAYPKEKKTKSKTQK